MAVAQVGVAALMLRMAILVVAVVLAATPGLEVMAALGKPPILRLARVVQVWVVARVAGVGPHPLVAPQQIIMALVAVLDLTVKWQAVAVV
jgi:hypothetical protein